MATTTGSDNLSRLDQYIGTTLRISVSWPHLTCRCRVENEGGFLSYSGKVCMSLHELRCGVTIPLYRSRWGTGVRSLYINGEEVAVEAFPFVFNVSTELDGFMGSINAGLGDLAGKYVESRMRQYFTSRKITNLVKNTLRDIAGTDALIPLDRLLLRLARQDGAKSKLDHGSWNIFRSIFDCFCLWVVRFYLYLWYSLPVF